MQSAYNLISLFDILAFIATSGKRFTVERCTVMMSIGNRLVYDTGYTTCLVRQPDFQLAGGFQPQKQDQRDKDEISYLRFMKPCCQFASRCRSILAMSA